MIAALGATAGGLVALPTLASYSLRKEAADVLMKIGHSISGCDLFTLLVFCLYGDWCSASLDNSVLQVL